MTKHDLTFTSEPTPLADAVRDAAKALEGRQCVECVVPEEWAGLKTHDKPITTIQRLRDEWWAGLSTDEKRRLMEGR